MEPRLIDVIRAFEKRGQIEKAEYYRTVIPFELFMKHQLSEAAVLGMTIDEIEGWYQKPPRPIEYEGWDGFWWGQAVNADYDKRNT